MVQGHRDARWWSHEVWALGPANPGPEHSSAGTVLCVGPDAPAPVLVLPGVPRGQEAMPPSLPDSLPPGQHPRATVLEQREAGIPLGRGCRTLTLQACPSSRAALSASSGLSITLPVCPEKSMATREFSETLRCRGERVLSMGTARALGARGREHPSQLSEVRVEIQGQTGGPVSYNGFGLS